MPAPQLGQYAYDPHDYTEEQLAQAGQDIWNRGKAVSDEQARGIRERGAMLAKLPGDIISGLKSGNDYAWGEKQRGQQYDYNEKVKANMMAEENRRAQEGERLQGTYDTAAPIRAEEANTAGQNLAYANGMDPNGQQHGLNLRGSEEANVKQGWAERGAQAGANLAATQAGTAQLGQNTAQSRHDNRVIMAQPLVDDLARTPEYDPNDQTRINPDYATKLQNLQTKFPDLYPPGAKTPSANISPSLSAPAPTQQPQPNAPQYGFSPTGAPQAPYVQGQTPPPVQMKQPAPRLAPELGAALGSAMRGATLGAKQQKNADIVFEKTQPEYMAGAHALDTIQQRATTLSGLQHQVEEYKAASSSLKPWSTAQEQGLFDQFQAEFPQYDFSKFTPGTLFKSDRVDAILGTEMAKAYKQNAFELNMLANTNEAVSSGALQTRASGLRRINESLNSNSGGQSQTMPQPQRQQPIALPMQFMPAPMNTSPSARTNNPTNKTKQQPQAPYQFQPFPIGQ